MVKSVLSVFLIIVLCVLGSACTKVRFNERERLAQPDMQFQPTGLQADLENHIFSAREGAAGRFSSSGGGGCGCY